MAESIELDTPINFYTPKKRYFESDLDETMVANVLYMIERTMVPPTKTHTVLNPDGTMMPLKVHWYETTEGKIVRRIRQELGIDD